MKVAIKTSHGYLSFQPDGRIEYRPERGPWEEIDLEGFNLELVISPVPNPQPQPEPDDWPLSIIPGPHPSYIAECKDFLEQSGLDLSGPCGAFLITKMAAWGLRATGAGLLSKPSGNNCDGYATDIICYRDGRIIDVLGDGGNANTPNWNEVEPIDPSRYRPAINPFA